MTRIALRTLLLVGSLCVATALLGILFIDTIARMALAPSLSELGIELEEIAGLQLRPQSIEIERIDFRVDGSPAASRLEHLTIHYNWRELLTGKVIAIHAQNLQLSLTQTDSAQSPATNNDSSPLPSLDSIQPLIVTLPFETAIIDSLTLSPYLDAARVSLQKHSTSLLAELAHGELQAALSLQWQETWSPDAPANLTGSIALANRQLPVLDSDFTLSEQQAQTRLNASVHMQVERLQMLLDEHELALSQLIELQGDLAFELSLATTDTAQRDLNFELWVPAAQPLNIKFNDNATLATSTLQWLNPAELNINGDIGLSELGLSINANDLTGQFTLTPLQGAATTVAVKIPSLALTCTDIEHCTADMSTTIELDTYNTDELSANTLLVISDYTVILSPEQSLFVFAQGSRLQANTLQVADYALVNPNVLVQDSLEITLTNDGDWQAVSKAIDFIIPDLISAEKSTHFAVAAQRFQANSSRNNALGFQVEGDLQFRNIGSDWLTLALRKPEINLSVQATDDEINIQGNAHLADREIMLIDAGWALIQNTGTLNIAIPEISFGDGNQSFSQFFFRLPISADLIDGTLQGQATLQVQQDEALNWLIDGPVSLDANALSGFYEEIGLIKFSAALNGELLDSSQFRSEQNLPISIERIDVGLPIENIKLNYSVSTPDTLLLVNGFEASLFRGKVSSNTIAFDWSAQRNQAEVQIERLDLSRLLDLAAYDAVQATGFISGTLPVALTALKPSVSAGKLYVEAPGGAIHYAAIGGGGGNAALDFVNQALSNYQYDLMETTMEYQPSGELDLGVRLQGLNPDMNNGQRINLNLNINDNIPALLQSLQSGRSIADAVERALQ